MISNINRESFHFRSGLLLSLDNCDKQKKRKENTSRSVINFGFNSYLDSCENPFPFKFDIKIYEKKK